MQTRHCQRKPFVLGQILYVHILEIPTIDVAQMNTIFFHKTFGEEVGCIQGRYTSHNKNSKNAN